MSEEAPGKPETAPTWHHYPAHKPSGIEWLGEIPEHWREKRLKFSAELVKKKATSSDSVRKYIGLEHVASWSGQLLTELNEFQVEGESLLFERDDVLFGKLRPYLAKCFVASEPGRCTSELLVLRRREYEPEFLKYLLLVPQLISLIDGSTFGAKMPRAEWQFIGNLVLPLPAAEEQRAIADFLDRETARIDALIAKKERLIELLQEKRTARISHAVTKGLDSCVPMKDSGIEWLGEIPQHWEVRPLKHIADFINGIAFKPTEWSNEGVPIIRIENLNGGGEFNCTTRKVEAKYEVNRGDLLFGWSGNRGTSFGPFIWANAGLFYLNQHIFKITPYDIDKTWFFWLLRGVTDFVEKQAHGIIGLVHITRQDLGAIKVPMIPAEEQSSIADFLDRETGKIDALITRVHEGIERLKEYRSALISAAVTGKIDVRETDIRPS